MIRFERTRLPQGTRAFAHREDGEIVVQVSADLPARERLSALREALRAAPAAGWRSPRSPVLLPALAGSAGLRRAPEGRWTYRVAAAAVVAAVLAAAVLLVAVSLQPGGASRPSAAQPGRPLLTGPGPSPSQPAASHEPTASHQPGARSGSPGGQPGPAPAKTTTTGAVSPAPEASGTPAPVPTVSPPAPAPSPAQQSSSGSCVDLLGVTICV